MTNEEASVWQARLEKFVIENAEEAFFTGGVSDAAITSVEERLGVRLPDSYRWFLRRYGYGWVYGAGVLGIGLNERANVVDLNERYWHRLGMPRHLVAIENVDEYAHALDLAQGDTTDCPVVSWSGYDRHGAIAKADGFYAFLLDSWEDAKENWE